MLRFPSFASNYLADVFNCWGSMGPPYARGSVYWRSATPWADRGGIFNLNNDFYGSKRYVSRRPLPILGPLDSAYRRRLTNRDNCFELDYTFKARAASMGADKYDHVIAFGYSCFVQLFLKDETHHDFALDLCGDIFLKNRQKNCALCVQSHEVLYRCKYSSFDWRFLCESCLLIVKSEHEDSYIYGGTWKKKK